MLFLRMMEGNFELWQWVVLLGVMIPMTIKDIKSRHVNVYLILGAILGVLAIRVSIMGDKDIEILLDMIPGAIMLFVAMLSGQKIGYGDGLLLLFVGTVTGYPTTIVSLLISMILSAFLSGALLIMKKVDKETEIPFVPFMSLGIFAGGIL